MNNTNAYDILNKVNENILILENKKIIFANKASLDFFEIESSILINIDFAMLLKEEYHELINKKIEEIIEKKEVNCNYSVKLITQKNKTVEVSIQSYTQINEGVFIQIKPVEKLLNTKKIASNSYFSNEHLCSYTDEGIFLLRQADDKNHIFSWIIESINQGALRILNKKEEDILNLPLNKLLIPDFNYKLPDKIDSTFTESLEVYILNFKEYFKVDILGLNENKCILKIADVSELTNVRNEINRYLQRNELLTELLSISNYSKTYSHKFEKILERTAYHFSPKRILIIKDNPNAKEGRILDQWASEDTKSLSDDFFIPYEEVPSWKDMLTKKKMILGFSTRNLPKDLQIFLEKQDFKNIYAFAIGESNNKPYGSVIFENKETKEWDNTEINYLKMISVLICGLITTQINEKKLVEAKNHAEESDKLKSAFLANMSHDIRIPMTSIIGFSDLLADEELSVGEREEFIDLIKKSGKDLLTLIDNVIDMAKIQTNQIKIQKNECNLYHLFKDLYNIHSRTSKIVEQDDVNLILDLPEKFRDISFQTDEFRLKQIFDNLIDNAIKYTDKGEIRFGISNLTDSEIEFYVFDTGIGMEKKTQDLIFESFKKVDQSYTKEFTGVGLGLAISKNLVELMGGTIRVKSEIGRSSTFYFTQVAKLNFEKTIQEKRMNTPDTGWEGKIIIICEDVEENFKFLNFILEAKKATILWYKNGIDALNHIVEKKPVDLILMDIKMPKLNGLEATQKIKEISNVPIIIQTSYNMQEEKELAFEAGCTDCISKPINIEKLLNIINDILNK